jgi:APA family basic amino acid/polyamine antiporter
MSKSGSERPNSTALIRTIGRWSLTALVINSVIGSGIFGLPSVVSGRVGQRAPVAYLVAGAGMAVIAGCLAEVASQFRKTGGPYLYARETLGRFWGIQIAWMTWLSRIAAGSGTANLFTTYLGQVYPRATEPAYRFAILSALVGVLAVVNYVGVKSGARASDFFTALKLVLLGAFIGGSPRTAPSRRHRWRMWLNLATGWKRLSCSSTRMADSKRCCWQAARCAIRGTTCPLRS